MMKAKIFIIVSALVALIGLFAWREADHYRQRTRSHHRERLSEMQALAEFRGRHSTQPYTFDEGRSMRAYVFYYRVGEQQARDVLLDGFWRTELKAKAPGE